MLPALLGEPYPITVLISISVGLSVTDLASSIAFPISSISVPSSTKSVCQLSASNLALTFSVNAKSVEPSIVMLFESYKTISLPKPSVPASEAAS